MIKFKKTIASVGITTSLLMGGGAVVDNQINPYTDKTDRVEMVTVADIPNADDQKVELIKNKPEVRFKKWNGEVDFGLTYDGVKSAGSRPLFSKKMEYKNAKQEVHAYPLTDGFEIEVILKEKPKTNVVSFTLDNWENLDFFYQPALTQKEIDEGAFRPDNVVGSYAVYAKEKVNHVIGQTNYGTGKIGHIFRPKINDSAGTEVWGELHIENGILSVTIPQDFLDKAVYPVKHAAGLTFGYTSIGATPFNFITNELVGVLATAPASADIDSISIYGGLGTASASSFKAVMVLHSNHNILTNGVGGTASFEVTPGWKTATYGTKPSVTSGTDYDISGVISVTDSNDDNYFYYDVSGGNNTFYDFSNNYTTPTNPTDGDYTTFSLKILSIYATYTPSGGSAARRIIITN